MKNSGASAKPSVFSHWAWAAAVLLVVSSLTIYQIDLVPPSFDEWATVLSTSIVDWESPSEFLTLHNYLHASHMPGYYILLMLYGRLTSIDIAVLRYLSVLLYFPLLALVYRLGSDFVAPVAGLFALVIAVSNGFFNLYIADARPYTLFVLLSCVTIWLYLRVMHRRAEPTARDLLALLASVLALVMTHLFSATLLFSLGLYHLFFLQNKRRWLRVGLVIISAILLCLPMAAFVLNRYSVAYNHLGPELLNGADTITTWLSLMLNGQPIPLLLIAGAGIALGMRRRLMRPQLWLALPALFLIALSLVGEFTQLIRIQTMRHQLDGWPLLVLFASAGHYALYRWKPWLSMLLIVWLIAGIFTQRATNWWTVANIRAAAFWHPPTQALSRLAIEEGGQPYLIGYPYDQIYRGSLFASGWLEMVLPFSQSDYYFSRHGSDISVALEAGEFLEFMQKHALNSPTVWHFHPNSADATVLDKAAAEMRRLNYQWCEDWTIGMNTVINQYMWVLLDCQPPANPAQYHNELIKYDFFKTGLNPDADAVYFIGRWEAQNDLDQREYRMSYQLLDDDWTNVAQLDLPLVAEAELRQYSIDVSQAPPGRYRLMLILYETSTGARLPWIDNPGYVPEMLELAEINIGGA